MSPSSEQIYYNCLNIALDSDYKKLSKIKSAYSSWEDAWRKNAVKGFDPDKEASLLERAGLSLVLMEEGGFPEELREIPFPPFGLYIRGPLPRKDDFRLAIVGTRRVSREGSMIAKEFGAALAEQGFVIISGLAFGVDYYSHEGVMSKGGRAMVILASGAEEITPRSNRDLGEKILGRGGTIISEYPVNSSPFPRKFLARNRIVSGLSKGVLVIEAPKFSGSLATARFALEQDRDVFVVPGSIKDRNYEGSNDLLKLGAQIALDPNDILEFYGFKRKDPKETAETYNSEEERIIHEVLRDSPRGINIDKIVELTSMNVQLVNSTLNMLVLKGMAKEENDKYKA